MMIFWADLVAALWILASAQHWEQSLIKWHQRRTMELRVEYQRQFCGELGAWVQNLAESEEFLMRRHPELRDKVHQAEEHFRGRLVDLARQHACGSALVAREQNPAFPREWPNWVPQPH